MTLAHLAPNAAPARGGLLFDGAEWDFATVQRVYDAIEQIALRRSRPRRLSQPDRDHLGRADARRLLLGRHAADVRPLVLRQAFRARRGALPQGLPGARLRDRDQLQSMHQLLHGGEHDGDADAGASPTPLSATIISSRTITSSSSGPTPPASSTISTSPSAMSPPARSGTASKRSRRRSTPRMR